MIAENVLLFACTRQNFLDAHRQTVHALCRENEMDWDVVFSTAREHGVAPLVYSNLQQCEASELGIPRQVLNEFRLCLIRSVMWHEMKKEKLGRALSFFGARQIDAMLLKGSVLDLLVYEKPWYTTSVDVDLVLRCKRAEISDKDATEFKKIHHRTGIEYDYYDHHDVVLNGILPIDFDRIWDQATRIDFDGHQVYIASSEDMLITLCTNSCRKRFFRLKCLCDIAETINARDDLNWQELTARAKADQCSEIVYTALLATKMTLGCKLPDNVFHELAVGGVRASLIRFLIHYVSYSLPLSSVFPFSGGRLFNRKVNVSLVLPYVTFRRYQLWRRLKRLYAEWKPIE
jgi:hypothetical protein